MKRASGAKAGEGVDWFRHGLQKDGNLSVRNISTGTYELGIGINGGVRGMKQQQFELRTIGPSSILFVQRERSATPLCE